MNRDEAMQILSVYPFDGKAEGESQFQEALALAERDPELDAWFASEKELDGAIAQKFVEIPVPADLQSQLLAARKIVRVETRRRRAWLGAAAAILLAGAIFALKFFSGFSPSYREFRSYAVETATTFDHLDLQTASISAIREWLAKRDAPGDFLVPSRWNNKPAVGCRIFNWRGKKISLICFNLGDGDIAHLFILEQTGLSGALAPRPEFQTAANGITTAAWSDRKHIYIVTLRHGEEKLKQTFL